MAKKYVGKIQFSGVSAFTSNSDAYCVSVYVEKRSDSTDSTTYANVYLKLTSTGSWDWWMSGAHAISISAGNKTNNSSTSALFTNGYDLNGQINSKTVLFISKATVTSSSKITLDVDFSSVKITHSGREYSLGHAKGTITGAFSNMVPDIEEPDITLSNNDKYEYHPTWEGHSPYTVSAKEGSITIKLSNSGGKISDMSYKIKTRKFGESFPKDSDGADLWSNEISFSDNTITITKQRDGSALVGGICCCVRIKVSNSAGNDKVKIYIRTLFPKPSAKKPTTVPYIDSARIDWGSNNAYNGKPIPINTVDYCVIKNNGSGGMSKYITQNVGGSTSGSITYIRSVSSEADLDHLRPGDRYYVTTKLTSTIEYDGRESDETNSILGNSSNYIFSFTPLPNIFDTAKIPPIIHNSKNQYNHNMSFFVNMIGGSKMILKYYIVDTDTSNIIRSDNLTFSNQSEYDIDIVESIWDYIYQQYNQNDSNIKVYAILYTIGENGNYTRDTFKIPNTNIDYNIQLGEHIQFTGIQKTTKVKVNGEWKRAQAWVKVDGEWKCAVPWVKTNGEWKRTL